MLCKLGDPKSFWDITISLIKKFFYIYSRLPRIGLNDNIDLLTSPGIIMPDFNKNDDYVELRKCVSSPNMVNLTLAVDDIIKRTNKMKVCIAVSKKFDLLISDIKNCWFLLDYFPLKLNIFLIRGNSLLMKTLD